MNFSPVKSDSKCKYSFVKSGQQQQASSSETADTMIQLTSISLQPKVDR